jgi:hypothetical protein
MIQGDHGPVAIRNIRYKTYGVETVTLSDLKVAAYEGKFSALPDFNADTATRQMDIVSLEHLGTERTDHFAGKITGTMRIPKTGKYFFRLNLKWIPTEIDPDRPNGGGTFSIGDKTLFQIDGRKSGVASAIVNLEAGDHPIALAYYKSHKLWYVPTNDIVLAVEAPGIAYTNLSPAFKAVEAVGAITVPVKDQPVMLRSFMDHRGKKRTHVISVGEPGHINYTIDLSSGSLLKFWKGDFAESTLMWHERGEQQLATPLGSVIDLSGKPSIAFLRHANETWPDSSAGYNYSGYDVDQDGRPTFKYTLEKSEVRDSFEASPDGKKLTHRIIIKAEPGVKQAWCLVAEGNEIAKMPNGLFAVNGEFYIELNSKQEAVMRKTAANTTQLLLPVTVKENSGSATYSIVW